MLPLLTRLRTPRQTRWRAKTPTAAFAALLLVVPFVDRYTVEPGDTVWDIAQKFDSTVGEIVEANELPAGGDLIYPGDVLEIPSAHGPGEATRQRSTDVGPASYTAAAQQAGPDERRTVVHTVQPGDTIGALAVHYHAWTAELIQSNGGSTVLRVGQKLEVPVVVAAEQRAERANRKPTEAQQRAEVRRVITRTAREHGVDPNLALAVSWQEAGWQQDVVSPADAVGVMQVIPSTGRWLSEITGRDLDLRDLEDNVYAGVVLLKFLTDRTGPRRTLAGYYQGLASVDKNGMYADTKRYIANVRSIQRNFERGDYPY
jgi:N-acetylmuramoyl-L-alanine amidase